MSQVWFITGASRGLGRAIAQRVLEHGDYVVATARKVAVLSGLVDQFGKQVETLPLDVTDEQAVNSAIATAKEHFGCIDVLVNNAGYADMAPAEEMAMSSFKNQMDTDFYGTLYTVRAVLPLMRTQKSGRILNVTSIGGRIGSAGLSAYQSAKFAVEGLTEVLAKEVTPFGIQVTAVEPGTMRTEWATKSMGAAKSPVYQDTVGKAIAAIHEDWAGIEAQYVNEPAKVADALYKLAHMDKAPVHLLIGKDARLSAEQHAKWLASEDAKNAPLTDSTGA